MKNVIFKGDIVYLLHSAYNVKIQKVTYKKKKVQGAVFMYINVFALWLYLLQQLEGSKYFHIRCSIDYHLATSA